MLKKIKIENFKSVQNLEIDFGRINIFIGENGSGKTGILEAIAFGSAATQDKLDNEFLSTRGIRVTEPEFMKSAFQKSNFKKSIQILFSDEMGKNIEFKIDRFDDNTLKWVIDKNYNSGLIGAKKIKRRKYPDLKEHSFSTIIDHIYKTAFEFKKSEGAKEEISKDISKEELKEKVLQIINRDFEEVLSKTTVEYINKTRKLQKEIINKLGLANFLIYAPENFF
ncbi:hypothetical protein GCM10028895_03140 [Pontibacter rugosus]